jgi:flagellar L-ring protein precursor FlgH
MKKIIYIMILMSVYLNAQDMRNSSFYSLFSDNKASRTGDAVTIIVMESSQASNNAETNSSRGSDLGLNFSGSLDKTALPTAKMDMGTNNAFSGSGSTKTTGLVRTKISATIDSVLANGNMVIKGSRKIVINGEEQLVSIRGVVRYSDISSDNSVLSYNISDAEISFEGSGIIDGSQKPGWLTKFFHWIF